MAINKKLIHFKKYETFNGSQGINGATEPTNGMYGNIPEHSIVFIQDAKKIWTHGQLYDCDQSALEEIGLIKEQIEQIHNTLAADKFKEYDKEYLTFTALEDSSIEFWFYEGSEFELLYSYDRVTWSIYEEEINLPKGNKLYFKADTTEIVEYIGQFYLNGKLDVSGNTMSIVYSDNFIDKVEFPHEEYTLSSLFYECYGLYSVHNLILPATTLTARCYYCLFSCCENLINSPKLPATILAEGCYMEMFYWCYALANAPELPATELSAYCYSCMFQECPSLLTAPELPAMTLAEGCYEYMFSNCINLTFACDLPAENLTNECYQYMFSGCISLQWGPWIAANTVAPYCCMGMFSDCIYLFENIRLRATDLAEGCYQYMFKHCRNLDYVDIAAQNYDESYFKDWLYGVSPQGNIQCPETLELPLNSSSGVPTGWSVNGEFIQPEPEPEPEVKNDYLIFEALEDNSSVTCSNRVGLTVYYSKDLITEEKFQGSDLTIQLNKGEMVGFKVDTWYLNSSYDELTRFTGTGALEVKGTIMACYNPQNSEKIVSSMYFRNLFGDNNALVYAHNLILPDYVNDLFYAGMFAGCSNLQTAPQLPATTLAPQCYVNMFSGCQSLTSAPDLTAKTLQRGCYESMFDNCTSLNYIKMMATEMNAEEDQPALSNWVNNVSPTGTFVKDPRITLSSGPSGIPEGWTVMEEESIESLSLEVDNLSSEVDSLQESISNITHPLPQEYFNILHQPLSTPLHFKAIENTTVQVQVGSWASMFQAEYSINNQETWTSWNGSTINLSAGDIMYVRGNNPNGINGYVSAGLGDPPDNCCVFKFSGKVEAHGNIMSLIQAENFENVLTVPEGGFPYLFSNCTTLLTAPELPALNLSGWCYKGLFSGCTSLTVAPELPAINLASACYNSMFERCNQLHSIKIMAKDIQDPYDVAYLLYGVTTNGVLYKQSSLIWPEERPLPSTWTTQDYDVTTNNFNNLRKLAEVNVQSDWNATEGDALILNKPTFKTINGNSITGEGDITLDATSIECSNGNSIEEELSAKATKTELENYLPKSGGSLTGNLNVGNVHLYPGGEIENGVLDKGGIDLINGTIEASEGIGYSFIEDSQGGNLQEALDAKAEIYTITDFSAYDVDNIAKGTYTLQINPSPLESAIRNNKVILIQHEQGMEASPVLDAYIEDQIYLTVMYDSCIYQVFIELDQTMLTSASIDCMYNKTDLITDSVTISNAMTITKDDNDYAHLNISEGLIVDNIIEWKDGSTTVASIDYDGSASFSDLTVAGKNVTSFLTHNSDINVVTSLSNVPTNKAVVFAHVGTSQELVFDSSNLVSGRGVHVFIYNKTTTPITIIPQLDGSTYLCDNVTEFEIPTRSIAEVSMVYLSSSLSGSQKFIRSITV